MKNQTKEIPAESYSLEQLEAMLLQKKKAEKKTLENKRIEYEETREQLLALLGSSALCLSAQMKKFKLDTFGLLANFREMMLNYGSLRGGDKNKGSFEVKNDHFKVQFSSMIVKRFDERAELAEAKIKSFLTNFVKKRDKKIFELVNALLQRNEKNGDFDIGLINRLYKMEDKYDDQDWRDGIRLFKEAYSPSGTAQYARFFVKTETGSWQPILLDFSKLKLEGDTL